MCSPDPDGLTGVDAFRCLQRAKHIGKVVIEIDTVVGTGAGWNVVTGGFGGLGLVVAKWLIEEGAKFVALLSRSGRCDESSAVHGLCEAVRKTSCRVEMLSCDMSCKANVAETLQYLIKINPHVD
eukprot:Filipodium_phascolosomae@DN6183_c0_g1_i1.p1